MPDPTPHPIDVHVGARLRLARRIQRIPQRLVAEAAGVSHQQIQKYELGANRISASVLLRIGGLLNRPIAWFFEGLEPTVPGEPTPPHREAIERFLALSEGPELACLMMALAPARRRQVLSLVRAFADPAPMARTD